jgi:hypothetical protein
MDEPEISPGEARRMVTYLRGELERQRAMNTELRGAVAEMARTFQETLARANDAAESGDMDLVKRITYENRVAWQRYLQQIVRAAASPPSREEASTKDE